MDEFITEPQRTTEGNACPVNSHNDWDPLEEIIVGRLEGATIPSNHVLVTYKLPKVAAALYRPFAGRRYPIKRLDA